MNIDPAAVLALIGDLYAQVAQLQRANAALVTELAEARAEQGQPVG